MLNLNDGDILKYSLPVVQETSLSRKIKRPLVDEIERVRVGGEVT